MVLRVRELDESGDLLYVSGKQSMVEGLNAVAQGLRVALSHVRGENVFHPTLGLSLQDFGGRTREEMKASVDSAIKRYRRVSRVVSSRVLVDRQKNRNVQVESRVQPVEGDEFTILTEVG